MGRSGGVWGMAQQRTVLAARRIGSWSLVGGIAGAIIAPLLAASPAAWGQGELDVWAVADGLALEVDASGFSVPTAIATVPDPGDEPGDPIYYVAELRGSIKAVTADRSVVELTTVPTLDPPVDDLQGTSQSGLAGLCVAADAGLVFGTFAYPDEGGVLRNDVVRLDTGEELSTEVVDERRFTEVLAEFQSSAAHQIGGCFVDGERLFVGVGDGGNSTVARDPEFLLGKMLCFTLDGDPCAENAWAGDGGAAAYVYATGLRNPFGVEVVDGVVYTAENGIDIDRFLRVDAGADHMWDGSDESIATGADLVLDPSVSPVQLDHLASGHPLLRDMGRDTFVFSVFNVEPATGIMALAFDGDRGRPTGVPRYLLQYVGEAPQHVIAAGVGPDSIYTAGAFPGPDGTSDILRLYVNDQSPHPVEIPLDWGEIDDARLSLLSEGGCISCHSWLGQGGGIGPALDPFALDWRLRERLNTPEYEQRVLQLNADAGPGDEQRVAAREAVLAEEGHARTREWLEHFLQDPQFDNPDVQMPNPGLTEEEALAIRDTLVPAHRAGGGDGLFASTIDLVRNNRRAAAVGFLMGGASAAVVVAAIFVVGRARRRRNDGRGDGGAPAAA
jgi:hypothetical protein